MPVSELEPVKRVVVSNANEFLTQISSNTPFVFKNYSPAISKWSNDFFRNSYGSYQVSVSTGVDESTRKTLRFKVSMSDYLDSIKYSHQSTRSNGDTKYLKQCAIFDDHPELSADIDLSFIASDRKDLALWIGRENSITGLHCDPNNGALLQITGNKRVILFSPSQRHLLYTNKKFDPATEYCDVNAEYPDLEQHPLFSQSHGLIIDLFPSDILIIPRKWYHYVRGINNNISVNCFFYSDLEYYTTDLIKYRIPKYLHNKGLYKVGNCVCHNSEN